MDFGQALKLLKQQNILSRKSWKDNRVWIAISSTRMKPNYDIEWATMSGPHIYQHISSQEITPWSPNSSDMLADDWYERVIPSVERERITRQIQTAFPQYDIHADQTRRDDRIDTWFITSKEPVRNKEPQFLGTSIGFLPQDQPPSKKVLLEKIKEAQDSLRELVLLGDSAEERYV